MTARRPGRQAIAAVGLLAVLAYVSAAALSARLLPGRPRPLLDGLAPPPPYNWVTPPPELVGANQPPQTGFFAVLIGPAGSDAAAFATPDGQAGLTLAQGAIPPGGDARDATLELIPADAGGLAELPEDLYPWGNAYRLVVTLRGGTLVEELAIDGRLSLVSAAHAQGASLLYSRDGQGWAPVASQPFGNADRTALVRRTGFYLVAGPDPLVPPPPPPPEGALPRALFALAPLALLAAGVYAARRRAQRRRAASWSRLDAARRAHPPRPKRRR